MAVSRADRRRDREPKVRLTFGDRDAGHALDLLELLEYAWHDCYDEVSPPEDIIEDILVVSEGSLAGLIAAAHLALTDWRDLKVAVAVVRGQER